MYSSSAFIALNLLLSLSSAQAQDGTRNLAAAATVTVAAYGDWPYSQTLLDNSMKLVNSVNADKDVQLVAHVGDIHSGSMPCTGAGMNQTAFVVSRSENFVGLPLPVVNPLWNVHVEQVFQKFKKPVVYTPGDNEWADCHKSKQLSSGAPLAELTGVRELFFPVPGELMGLTPKTVTSQATAFTDPADAQFVENVMWMEGAVMFATFNIPGGSNDDDEVLAPWTGVFKNVAAQKNERVLRQAANLRWLDAAFASANSKNAKAIVLMTQADMWDTQKFPTPGVSLHTPFIKKLAALTLSVDKPVLLINGDSHVFKVDTPLTPNPDIAAGIPITSDCDTATDKKVRCDLSTIHGTPPVVNFLRIVVKGSPEPGELYWLKLKINPNVGTNVKDTFTYQNVCYDNCNKV